MGSGEGGQWAQVLICVEVPAAVKDSALVLLVVYRTLHTMINKATFINAHLQKEQNLKQAFAIQHWEIDHELLNPAKFSLANVL